VPWYNRVTNRESKSQKKEGEEKMTKKQFEKKTRGLAKVAVKFIEKESLRLFESGGIDTKKYENNYLLPKICLYVALQNTAWQHKPLADSYIKEAKNLLKF